MNRSRRASGFVAILTLLGAVTGAIAAEDLPDWLESVRNRKGPAAHSRSGGIFLYEEERVDAAGSSLVSRTREAVRIQTGEGLREFAFFAPESIGSDFKLIGAWRVSPDGSVKAYAKKDIPVLDADGDYEFSQSRVHVLKPADLRVGDVLGWEYEFRRKPEAWSDSWVFGGAWHTLESRYALKLPSNWKFRTHFENLEPPTPARDDEGYIGWRMRDIEPPPIEPLGPPMQDLMPALRIAWGPGDGDAGKRQFETWGRIASWYSGIMGRMTVADATIAQAAKEAAKGASGLEGMRGIARLTRGVRYLNVAIGRSVAEPHPAADVLKNRFGDCEDKTALSIALLRAAGFEAWPMLVNTRSGGAIAPEFPTIGIFNHVITAIRIPEGATLAASFDAGPAGRFVVFDPTDATTALGDLSDQLQGTRGVLAHPELGGLMSLPILPPEANQRETSVRIVMTAEGRVEADLARESRGQAASGSRGYYESVRGDRRRDRLAGSLRSRFGDGEVTRLDVTGVEDPDAPILETIVVRSPLPGRVIGSMKTLVPLFLLDTQLPRLVSLDRKLPIHLGPAFEEVDRIIIEVPPGWRLEKAPADVIASTPAGRYSLTFKLEGAGATVLRELSMKSMTLPATASAELQAFLSEAGRGDATELVLMKTDGAKASGNQY